MVNRSVVRRPKFTIAMKRKLARKMKTYGRSAMVDSSRCIVGLRGAFGRPSRLEEFDRRRERRIDRPGRIPQLCARLRRIEEHFLSRHPHFGQARARGSARDGARKRFGAE